MYIYRYGDIHDHNNEKNNDSSDDDTTSHISELSGDDQDQSVYTTNSKETKHSKYLSENEPYKKKKRKSFRPLKPLVLRPYIALPAVE